MFDCTLITITIICCLAIANNNNFLRIIVFFCLPGVVFFFNGAIYIKTGDLLTMLEDDAVFFNNRPANTTLNVLDFSNVYSQREHCDNKPAYCNFPQI